MNRENINAEYSELLKSLSAKIFEVIDEYHKEPIKLESNLAVLIILRQIAEYVDGASVLIANKNSDSLVPILRTIIELSIGADYILKKDFNSRSKKLLFFYYQKIKEQLQESLASKDSRVYISLKNDKYVSEETRNIFQKGSLDNLQTINQIDALLAHPSYAELKNYYNMKKGAIKNWYSLIDGPQNFEQLCNSLEKNSVYEISYRRWTGYTHGWNIINNNLEFLDSGEFRIAGPRKEYELRDRVLEILRFSRSPLLRFHEERSTFEQKMQFFIWLKEFNERTTTIFPELL